LTYGESWIFPRISGLYFSETVEQLLIQYYSQRVQEEKIAKKIMLPPGEFSAEALSGCIQELCDEKVIVKIPGDREKVSLAIENAQAKISQHLDLKDRKDAVLDGLHKRFFLSKWPNVIDCFDASHHAGSDGVAACVGFVGGEKSTKRYRTFIIQGRTDDDLSMLHEAVLRRYAKKDFPDLILIDGGQQQLHAVQRALKKLSAPKVDLVAISKDEGKHTRAMTCERFFLVGTKDSVRLSSTSSELRYIQLVRDEAHRFVSQFHRKRRRNTFFLSKLSEIRGIGPKKRQKLLSVFRGVQELQAASAQEIQQRAGLSIRDAREIERFFSSDFDSVES